MKWRKSGISSAAGSERIGEKINSVTSIAYL